MLKFIWNLNTKFNSWFDKQPEPNRMLIFVGIFGVWSLFNAIFAVTNCDILFGISFLCLLLMGIGRIHYVEKAVDPDE